MRPIACEVGLLPRTHGSALFTRGQTQALSIATLGSPGDAQQIETLAWEDEHKRYLHHYNFPPYSTGETGRLGAPSRRSIGHGHLAERALLPVLPAKEDFPYTIRVVSEIISSNGSTSMASVCGSTLSLMDAGVPLAAPVAGVAMGLVLGSRARTRGKHAVLTDILGIGRRPGRHGLQGRRHRGRDHRPADGHQGQGDHPARSWRRPWSRPARRACSSWAGCSEALAAPRPQLSPYAPKMVTIKIPTDKIGALIGPGGQDHPPHPGGDRRPRSTSTTPARSTSPRPRARGWTRPRQFVRGLTEEVEVGKIYLGKITRLMNFGAFAEILPGKEGLIHISELAEHRINRVEDVVEVGDEVMVMVTEVDPQGRVNLSRRAVIEGQSPEDVAARKRELGPPRGGGGFGGPPRGPGGPGGPRRARWLRRAPAAARAAPRGAGAASEARPGGPRGDC